MTIAKPKPEAAIRARALEEIISRAGVANLSVRLGLVSREEEAVRDAARDRKERIAKQARELAGG
ncbi:hypothetical protein [Methylorubrum extorquens]|uniref:hypothetical protein n=1 Tax=Methylorubrum extorquens TaxID=408 RepID=UPI001237689B|nr:hypothetical protein [Methylorubrum extorquens]WIU39348.1 hypothetical protein KQ926_22685 [Methylorubrum extorquens]